MSQNLSQSKIDDVCRSTAANYSDAGRAQLLLNIQNKDRSMLYNTRKEHSSLQLAEDLWGSLDVAHRTNAETLALCQRQQTQIIRVREELDRQYNELQRESCSRHALQKQVEVHECTIAELHDRLSLYERHNYRRLPTFTQSNPSATDRTRTFASLQRDERKSMQESMSLHELRSQYEHLQRQLDEAHSENVHLTHQVQQWAHSFRQLRSQSQSIIAEKDRMIQSKFSYVGSENQHLSGLGTTM